MSSPPSSHIEGNEHTTDSEKYESNAPGKESPEEPSDTDGEDDESDGGDESERNGHVKDDAPSSVLSAETSAGAERRPAHADTEDSDDDAEDGEEDDDDEDDEDEDEPALKYERIGGSLPDLLKKDSASALAITNKTLALGTHGGVIHMLDLKGTRLKSYRPHLASVCDISVDSTGDFIATASMDGQVVIHSLSTPESYAFDMKRPVRTVCLEPHFAKRSTRAFVCGGMAGALVLREKGWLGHKETALHDGEGPIWSVRWRGRLIAWANDMGVKIYDVASQTRITYIDRPPDSPRADLFKCTLHWQDDSTLLIAWADHIKVARVRARARTQNAAAAPSTPPLVVEITAVFQVDCMIAGIAPHPAPNNFSTPPPLGVAAAAPPATAFLLLAYTPADDAHLRGDELTEDRARQARKPAARPELRVISRAGEELAADALGVAGFQSWACGDYALAEVDGGGGADGPGEQRWYVVLSPRDVIIVKPRDRRDHVAWLVEQRRYEEALHEMEKIEEAGEGGADGPALSVSQVGQLYIEHLVDEGDFATAAKLCPKVCGQDVARWEKWIFFFAEKRQLPVIIPFVPTDAPRLNPLVYNMVLAYFLSNDRQALLHTIKEWPRDIYDVAAVIVAVQSELDRSASSSSTGTTAPESVVLMECLAELYTLNRQPGKALPYVLRLRRANVLDLIREHNLFTDVQDQVLLLVEFDHGLMQRRRQAGGDVDDKESEAIRLLVDHVHSIPIARVVQQLQSRPYYLFLYLHALFERDRYLVVDYSDLQVKLYAEYATARLIDFLRASSHYNLETAYKVCKEQDLVPEMVFLLGRMGNNKEALTLIIERLGDVQRAIEFAKEQNDNDLWEDLLKYSETRPLFIRGLLENAGADIGPIRLIRRIKNGLEIPGLKESLIKILQDFHLQISLLEGCQTILDGDCTNFSGRLQRDQTSGFLITTKTGCPICSLPLQQNPQQVLLLFLCRHVVHAGCTNGGEDVPFQPEPTLASMGIGGRGLGVGGKIAFAATVKARIRDGCPVCHRKAEGDR